MMIRSVLGVAYFCTPLFHAISMIYVSYPQVKSFPATNHGGVALHQHFMSWLGLLAGAKRWYLAAWWELWRRTIMWQQKLLYLFDILFVCRL